MSGNPGTATGLPVKSKNAKRKSTSSSKSFDFCGEEGVTYKVDWGDGRTDTYTGKGAEVIVSCSRWYSTAGTYTVLLYGVIENKK